ncbi:MAG: hypothetical protein ACHQFW_07875, partial [Chitinophagales bacterium]
MKFFLPVCIATLLSCSAQNAQDLFIQGDWPTKATLMKNFMEQDSALIVYGEGETELKATLEIALGKMKEFEDRFYLIAKSASEVTDKEIKSLPLYIIGTKKNTLLKRFEDGIPLKFVDDGFVFDEKIYNMKSDLIKLSFLPNNFNPQLPVSI